MLASHSVSQPPSDTLPIRERFRHDRPKSRTGWGETRRRGDGRQEEEERIFKAGGKKKDQDENLPDGGEE